jgi:hypothetical protein
MGYTAHGLPPCRPKRWSLRHSLGARPRDRPGSSRLRAGPASASARLPWACRRQRHPRRIEAIEQRAGGAASAGEGGFVGSVQREAGEGIGQPGGVEPRGRVHQELSGGGELDADQRRVKTSSAAASARTISASATTKLPSGGQVTAASATSAPPRSAPADRRVTNARRATSTAFCSNA